MSIISIQETIINDDHVTVTAMVEDSHLQYHATLYDPPEYTLGLCQATFYTTPEETIPTDEASFIDFLDELDLTWVPILVDTSDYF